MIADNIKNLSAYNFNKDIAKAFAFCNEANEKEIGRYDITDKIFAVVQMYDSKPFADCVSEAHKKFIDLQFIVSGVETMGCCEIDCCEPIGSFDYDNDYQFFKNCDMKFREYGSGDFAFFFPKDVHMPKGNANGRSMTIKKVVVKIPLEDFCCEEL